MIKVILDENGHTFGSRLTWKNDKGCYNVQRFVDFDEAEAAGCDVAIRTTIGQPYEIFKSFSRVLFVMQNEAMHGDQVVYIDTDPSHPTQKIIYSYETDEYYLVKWDEHGNIKRLRKQDVNRLAKKWGYE